MPEPETSHERTTRWRIGAVVAVVAIVAGAGIALSVSQFSGAAGDAEPTETPRVVTAVFLGDSFFAGNDETVGSSVSDGMMSVTGENMGWQFQNFAQGGTGYVDPGRAGGTTVTYAGHLPEVIAADPDVVIVGGGINDRPHGPERLIVATADLYDQLEEALPDAQIVVVGPIAPGGPGLYPDMEITHDIIKSAALEAGLPFIDPIEEGWLLDRTGLVGPTNFHPNKAGHALLAKLLTADLHALGIPAGTPDE